MLNLYLRPNVPCKTLQEVELAWRSGRVFWTDSGKMVTKRMVDELRPYHNRIVIQYDRGVIAI